MTNVLLVGIGGFLGSAARYLITGLVTQASAAARFPLGTLAVNILGCFAIGLVAGLAERADLFSAQTRLFLVTGVLGGFTTFSAFAFETYFLGRETLIARKTVANMALWREKLFAMMARNAGSAAFQPRVDLDQHPRGLDQGVDIGAFEAGLSYSQDRKVFGSAVFDYQLSKVKIARMAAATQAGRQASYDVARKMAAGEGTLEASMVKAYVCKAAEWVTREAMQIHGGFGYAEEYSVSRLFVDARVLSIFEGADETLCLKVIARRLVDTAS